MGTKSKNEIDFNAFNTGKNFKLNYEGFEEYMIDDTPFEKLGGAHYIFKFPNGYGASVIKHLGSYGFSDDLWELAAIKFFNYNGKQHNPDGWDLCRIKELNLDIRGFLSDESVRQLLGDIQYYVDTNK